MSKPKPMPTYWALAEEVTHLHGQLDKLNAENAKLRELVRHAFACIRKGEDEYGTDWSCIGCEFDESCVGFEQLASVAYELGVEVDA
jgi:hypothetical protein